MTEPLLATPPPPEWTEAARWLRSAQTPTMLDGEAWTRAIEGLRLYGLAPLFADRVLKNAGAAELPEALRGLLQREEARAKASYSALMQGVERVLDAWASAGTKPYILKGLHLAHAYYPAPHLRPMADADVLFRDLGDGERAWKQARDLGLEPQSVPLSKNPWLGAYELPMLVDPATGFTLEVQGSLIFNSGDRRSAAAANLLEDPASWTLCGRPVLGMAPEALLVYLFAHAFVHHETALGTRLYALEDAAMILERTGQELDWQRVTHLATTAGFAGPVALGLCWTRNLLGASVPDETLAGLDSAAAGFTLRPLRGSDAKERQDALTFEALLHEASWRTAFALLWSRTCPTGEYMRHRYPNLARWPLASLYPYRWAQQVVRGMRLVVSRIPRGRR